MGQINRVHRLSRPKKRIHIALVFQNRLLHLFIIAHQLCFFRFRGVILIVEPLKPKNKVMQSAILRSVCKQQCHTSSLHFSVFFILTRQLKLPGISRQDLLQVRQLKRMPQLSACLRTGKLFHDLLYRTGIASFLRKVKICGCPQHTVLIKQGITVQAV